MQYLSTFFTTLWMGLVHPRAAVQKCSDWSTRQWTCFAVCVLGLTMLGVVFLWSIGIRTGNMWGLLREMIFLDVLLISFLMLIPVLIGVLWLASHAQQHLAQRLGGQGSLNRTFGVVALSASALVFHLVPVVGEALVMVDMLIIVVVGMREVHAMSWARSSMSIPLQLVLAYIVAIWWSTGVARCHSRG